MIRSYGKLARLLGAGALAVVLAIQSAVTNPIGGKEDGFGICY